MGISIDAIQHHKNRKTSNLQTGILTGLLPDYHHYSANGQLAVFRARTNGRWHSRFPECFESYFLDYDDNLHSKPSELESVHDSPPGSSYPKMSEGPNCLTTTKFMPVLLHFVLLRHNQLKNWFNNNRITQVIPKIGKCSQKIQVVPSRVPRAVHLFSQKYYPTRVYLHVAMEAARHEMTTYIWDNETPEIKQDVANCVEKERELITAFKEGTLKASDLSDDKKAAYSITSSGASSSSSPVALILEQEESERWVAGHIPGTPEGESRAFGQYYGLPFMYHMKKVHFEVSAPIGQPHVGLSAEKSFIPSPVIYPSLAAASTPPSPATASVAPHTPETVFISPQSSASNTFQGLEPLQSGTLMDTSMDFLNVPPLTVFPF
ncbi:hypothetical protein F5146DRAFT_1006033 [Armillaria mellea]|nr:hypothetical protein F5146DRAFT_1006033 [Armillaria mellea]